MARKWGHSRNVAGYVLERIANAVYQQAYPDGKKRLYIKSRVEGKRHLIRWRYTEAFTDEATKESNKAFPTLTEAVMAAHKLKAKH